MSTQFNSGTKERKKIKFISKASYNFFHHISNLGSQTTDNFYLLSSSWYKLCLLTVYFCYIQNSVLHFFYPLFKSLLATECRASVTAQWHFTQVSSKSRVNHKDDTKTTDDFHNKSIQPHPPLPLLSFVTYIFPQQSNKLTQRQRLGAHSIKVSQ